MEQSTSDAIRLLLIYRMPDDDTLAAGADESGAKNRGGIPP